MTPHLNDHARFPSSISKALRYYYYTFFSNSFKLVGSTREWFLLFFVFSFVGKYRLKTNFFLLAWSFKNNKNLAKTKSEQFWSLSIIEYVDFCCWFFFWLANIYWGYDCCTCEFRLSVSGRPTMLFVRGCILVLRLCVFCFS